VRNRVNRLRDDGILQIVGVVDPHLLGMRSTAIIGVVAEPARLQQVAREIASYGEVSYLVMTSGTFDLLVEILCEDTDHLARLLSEQLHNVQGVRRTETFYIFRNYKLSYRWGMVPELPRRP
jgi:Lrp/AsnC family transcriptional regulator for asnA, asnC and gidA